MDKSAEAVAHLFVRAINRHDVSGLADMMANEHRFIDSLGNVVVGQHEGRRGWAGYFGMVPDYAITISESYGAGSVVIMLGTARGTFVPPPAPPSYFPAAQPKAAEEAGGQLNPENAWKTPIALRVLVENGRVAEWRVYADNEPIRELMRKNLSK
jgi:hypothetical protein